MSCYRCTFRKRLKKLKNSFQPERDCYLDYNATTPVDPRVLGAFERNCRKNWGNPSSLHGAGMSALGELENHKNAVADWLGCSSGGIHFCSSGSEALHAALYGAAKRNPDYRLLTTRIEHSAVLHPFFHLSREKHQSRYLETDSSGKIKKDQLNNILKDKRPVILVYSPVNHETGSTQNARKIYARIKQNNDNSLIIIDGVQAAARMTPEKWVPFCDLFAISGHKIYAPKGTALLWRKKGLRIRPFRFGGGQENGVFPGTENTPGIAALAEAAQLMKKEFSEGLQIQTSLINDLLYLLQKKKIDFIRESPEDSVPGVINISFPNLENSEDFLFHLNSRNIYFSRFSACTQEINKASSVLSQMGVPEERSQKSFRLSLGRFSKREDIFRFVEAAETYLSK